MRQGICAFLTNHSTIKLYPVTMKLKLNCICLPLLFLALSIQEVTNAQQITRKVKETQLVKMDSVLIGSSFTYSSNMMRVGCCVRNKNKQVVMINGIKGKLYDSVCLPIFSPDGKHFVYRAINNKKWIWVSGDAKETSIDSTSPMVAQRFGPDSRSMLQLFTDGNKFFLRYNNSRGKSYDAINFNSITISRDGKKIAYSARVDNKQLNVFDNQEGALFDNVGFPVLSANGLHIGYWAIDNSAWYAIIDNVKGRPFEEVGSIIFSDNGEHYLYRAKLDKKHVVVTEKSMSEKYEKVHSVALSPDGSRVAYAFRDAQPDKEGFDMYVFADGKRIGSYETLVEGSVKFSSDSKTLIYKAEIHDEFFIVVKDKPGKRYSDVLQAKAAFSPDNSRFAYVAENDTKRFINEAGVEGKPYQDIYAILFSADNKRMLYAAKQDNKELVVVDGNDGRSYDFILGEGQVVFDSPTSFHYMAAQGKNILLVQESIE